MKASTGTRSMSSALSQIILERLACLSCTNWSGLNCPSLSKKNLETKWIDSSINYCWKGQNQLQKRIPKSLFQHPILITVTVFVLFCFLHLQCMFIWLLLLWHLTTLQFCLCISYHIIAHTYLHLLISWTGFQWCIWMLGLVVYRAEYLPATLPQIGQYCLGRHHKCYATCPRCCHCWCAPWGPQWCWVSWGCSISAIRCSWVGHDHALAECWERLDPKLLRGPASIVTM